MLDLIPYKKMRGSKVKLLKRLSKGRYDNQASLHGRNFVAESQESSSALAESALDTAESWMWPKNKYLLPIALRVK
jgi:hypothetical protein